MLIPPGVSLVTHAARPLLSATLTGPWTDLPLVLHPSFLGPAARLHRHASGNSRGPWAVGRAPTQVMHGPSYIFHPLPLAGPLLSHRLGERIALYPFPFSPFSPSPPSPFLALSLFLLCVYVSCIYSPRSSSPRRPVRTKTRRVHGARPTSSTRATRCNACYCPSCYRYATDRPTRSHVASCTCCSLRSFRDPGTWVASPIPILSTCRFHANLFHFSSFHRLWTWRYRDPLPVRLRIFGYSFDE